MDKSTITTATNEAYGKVKGVERDDGYELTDFSSPPPPSSSSTKLEEMYEVPSFLSSPSQPLSSLSPPPSAVAHEKETVYAVIPGETGHK